MKATQKIVYFYDLLHDAKSNAERYGKTELEKKLLFENKILRAGKKWDIDEARYLAYTMTDEDFYKITCDFEVSDDQIGWVESIDKA